MLSKLTELIQQKNDSIRKINFSLIHINALIKRTVEEKPEIVNYSWEPMDISADKFVHMDYPLIYVAIPPFKTILDCEELIALVNGNFNYNNIEKIFVDLILKKINN